MDAKGPGPRFESLEAVVQQRPYAFGGITGRKFSLSSLRGDSLVSPDMPRSICLPGSSFLVQGSEVGCGGTQPLILAEAEVAGSL